MFKIFKLYWKRLKKHLYKNDLMFDYHKMFHQNLIFIFSFRVNSVLIIPYISTLFKYDKTDAKSMRARKNY